MAREFIYHMRGLSKTYPGKKVLDNIHLSFYPDAKIGVLGVNGSGKSTLLRIMAGIDTELIGDGWVAEGARVGYLPQEPQLDPAKNVRENVMEGVAREPGDPRPLQRARHELLRRDRRRDDRASRTRSRRRACGTSTRRSSRPWTRSRCPPDDWPVDTPLRRRAPPRRALQAPARAARTSAPRRADQPSRRRDRRLARRASAQLSGRDPDRHPRPLLPRQRHRLDPRARPRPRHPLRGQLLVLARAEAEAPRAGRPRGGSAPAHHRARARVGVGLAEGPAGQVEGPHPALRGPRRQGRREGRRRRRRSSSRSPSASARTSSSSTSSRRASATSCSSTACPSSCRPAASSA